MERNQSYHEAYLFFRQHPLVTLTTLSKEGIPQNAAAYVYVDEYVNCYFASREEARKVKNIKENRMVVLSASDESDLTFGELLCDAVEISEKEEIIRILPELQKILTGRKSAYWIPPVAQLDGDSFVFFKCVPKLANFVRYDTNNTPAIESYHLKPMV